MEDKPKSRLRFLSYALLPAIPGVIYLFEEHEHRLGLVLASALSLLLVLVERRIQGYLREDMEDSQASHHRLLNTSVNNILHHIAQPAFAVKIAWEQIASVVRGPVAVSREDYEFMLGKLFPIFGDSVGRLNREIDECRRKMTDRSLRTGVMEFKEVLKVMPRVSEICLGLDVRLTYLPRATLLVAQALKAKTFGDVDQFREVLLSACAFTAKYAASTNNAEVFITHGVNGRHIWVKVDCRDGFITPEQFAKLTSGNLEGETRHGLGNAVRIIRNFGGSFELADGFLLLFPKK